jgi:pyruvate, water dikinase
VRTSALGDLRRADEERFGGKSALLGELIGAEIPVPPGFAISSEAYLAAVEGLELDGRSPEECARAIRELPVPEDLRKEIAERYEGLASAAGDTEPAVAVRSSAIGEDSEEATFAGQQQTYLWVRGADGVCAAVRDCWASLYSAEAVTYRAEMAAEHAVPAMGVTVQLMVDAAVSGVMFTCNPVSGDPSTIAVNASWGLGLAVVGGEVTPDEYRVSKVTRELLSKSIGPKEVEYVPDPSGSGAAKSEVARDRSEAACLGEAQLAELVEVGRRVEDHFGAPQDIEWAIARRREGAPQAKPRSHPSHEGPDALGELFMLQARPVTVKPAERAKPDTSKSAMDRVWSTFGATGGGSR